MFWKMYLAWCFSCKQTINHKTRPWIAKSNISYFSFFFAKMMIGIRGTPIYLYLSRSLRVRSHPPRLLSHVIQDSKKLFCHLIGKIDNINEEMRLQKKQTKIRINIKMDKLEWIDRSSTLSIIFHSGQG